MIVQDKDWQSRIKANTKNLAKWTAAWVLTMAVAAFGPKLVWNFDTTLTIIAVALNLLVGFKMILANRKCLADMDEMQQRIQGEAMALSLGIGLVFGSCYELLEDIRLISFEPEISHLVIVMCLTFMGGIIRGRVKYQ